MNNSQGFSLIEVLITIVLTTVGILGMVALQSRSIHYTQEAVSRNTAIALTNELIEIIRANRDEVFNKTPPLEIMYSELKNSSAFYTASGALDFSTADCATPAQTAKEQAGCWLVKAQTLLPGANEAAINGQFMLCPSFRLDGDTPECAANYAGSTLAIQVAWRSKEAVCGPEGNTDICTFMTRVEL